jgi:hypothetical protein
MVKQVKAQDGLRVNVERKGYFIWRETGRNSSAGAFMLAFTQRLEDKVLAHPLNSSEHAVFTVLCNSVSKGNQCAITRQQLLQKLHMYKPITVDQAVKSLKDQGYLHPAGHGKYAVNPWLFWKGSVAEWQAFMEAEMPDEDINKELE